MFSKLKDASESDYCTRSSANYWGAAESLAAAPGVCLPGQLDDSWLSAS